MTKKIVNRVLVSIPVLIGVILIIYVMLNVIPGNPIEVMMAEHARQDVIDRISAYYGLDKPVWEQFLIYLNNLLHGDLGVSYKLNRSVNSLIADAMMMKQPPSDKGKRLKIYYVTQVGIEPPLFSFQVNKRSLMHFSYSRYIENRIRDTFGFEGTSIKFVFREKREKDQ